MGNRNNRNPLVSVIVPVYNVEDFLGRCINSILNQTYTNLEILLIDDGATDRSGAICDSFAASDPRIRVIHQENAGVSGARNKGIELCTGEYIVFIDPDDYISKEFIHTLLDTACRTGCEIVQCNAKDVLYKDTASIADCSYEEDPLPQNVNVIYLSGREMCVSLLDSTHEDCGVIWNKLYKTSLFEELRFPVGRIHEDDSLIYRLYWDAAHIAVCDVVLYYYQLKRPESIMNKKYSLNRLDAIQARKEQYEFFEQVGDEELCEKAKAEFIRSAIEQIRQLKKSNIANREKIAAQLRKETVSMLGRCLFGRYLSMRAKAGLIKRLLTILG